MSPLCWSRSLNSVSMPNGIHQDKDASAASNCVKSATKASDQRKAMSTGKGSTIRRWLSISKKSKSICDDIDVSSSNPLPAPKCPRNRIFSLKIGDKISFRRKPLNLAENKIIHESNKGIDIVVTRVTSTADANDDRVLSPPLASEEDLTEHEKTSQGAEQRSSAEAAIENLHLSKNIVPLRSVCNFETENNFGPRSASSLDGVIREDFHSTIDQKFIIHSNSQIFDADDPNFTNNHYAGTSAIIPIAYKTIQVPNTADLNTVIVHKQIEQPVMEKNTEVVLNLKNVITVASDDIDLNTKSVDIDQENVTSIFVDNEETTSQCPEDMSQHDAGAEVEINPASIVTSILLTQTNSNSTKHEDSIDINDPDGTAQQSVSELSIQDQAKVKRKYVLAELIETERDYVKDLGSVIESYIPALESPDVLEDIRTKARFVFANIHQIYEFHKSIFLKEIENCVEDYDCVSRAFVKYERRLHMYVVYCQNKPKSEYLVSEYENVFNEIKQKLGHKLTLGDLLIKPIQRIMKYQLLMKDILKYTERAGENTDLLKKAQEVMHVVPKACDDMMHVGRLQGFEGKITAQGKLLLQGTVLVSDNPSNQTFKGKDRQIFLFEQSIIIADCILPKKEFVVPQYIYKYHFMINKLGVDSDVPGEQLRIILKSKDPSLTPQDVVLQFNIPEEKDEWTTAIKQLLDTQAVFLQALTHPIAYQKALSKEPEADSISQCSVSSIQKNKLLSRISQTRTSTSKESNAVKPQRTESYPGTGPPGPSGATAQRSGSAKAGSSNLVNTEKGPSKLAIATQSVSSCPTVAESSRKHSLPESSKHSVKHALAKSKPKNSATCTSLANECGRSSSHDDAESAGGSPGPATPGTKSRSKLFDGFKNTLKFFPSKLKNSQ